MSGNGDKQMDFGIFLIDFRGIFYAIEIEKGLMMTSLLPVSEPNLINSIDADHDHDFRFRLLNSTPSTQLMTTSIIASGF